jgi:ABC-2 type transport system permease protein
VTVIARHFRLAFFCARNNLLRELAFRGNFVLQTLTGLGWLVLLITFFWVIYGQTNDIAGWSKYQVLFLLGTHFLITTAFDAFFFENCLLLSDQVRTGGLDFVLLKPVDAQFLLSIRKVDFVSLGQLPAGVLMIGYSLAELGIPITWIAAGRYLVLVVCGVLLFYSIMFILATTSFWLIRNDNIFDLWWYVNSFSRYPADMYKDFLGGLFRAAMTYILPVLIVANVPAASVVRAASQPSHLIPVTLTLTVLFLALSRLFFRFALRRYQSASS